jgi:hypothetical protein
MHRLFLFFSLACGVHSAPAATPTFYKDVLPLLQEHCQSCHRDGEIGPMAFTSYRSTRPWARAIKQVVATRKMPPWFADPAHGEFSNARGLRQAEIDTLVGWVNAGAPEGRASEAPPPKTFPTGWNIPEPDYVVEMPRPFTIPAQGKVDYQYIVIPLNLTEDKWVQMVEARPAPEARSAVHHILVYVRDPESDWLRGEAEPGVPFVPPKRLADGRPRNDIGGFGNETLTIYTPGNVPDIFPAGRAKLIRAGSDLVLQMHYTPNGKQAVTDRSRIGFVWARTPPKERILTNALLNDEFAIPPGAANHEVRAEIPFRRPNQVLSFFPHMHLRGKSFEYVLERPDGTRETLLKVPDYNFNWQLTYRLKNPVQIPAGAKLRGIAHFDNSPNNPFNPDPKATVRWGEQSEEEMMIGFFDMIVPIDFRPDFQRQRRVRGSN